MARAAAFGVVTLALATGAHVLGGGAMPSMLVLALLTGPLTLAAVVLTRRRCGSVLLVGALSAAQVILHETMALASHVPGDAFPVGPGAQHGAHALASGQVSTHWSGADGWSVTMKAAHVVATLVTALLLARGEQVLWRLASRLLPVLPSELLLVGGGPLRSAVLASVPALRPSVVSGGQGLRGPPVRLAAAD